MTPTAANTKPSTNRDRALKLFIVLSRAMNAVTSHMEWHPDRNELTMTEFGILEALLHKGPLLLGDVQKKILLSSGGVTYTIDRLAEKGLVERQECTTDRRAKYTNELAVMMDSFRPLRVAKQALPLEDPKYQRSWIDAGSGGFTPPTS